MGLVMSEGPYHRPYIPLGCDQQSRVTPTKLTAAHLDRRQEERDTAAMSLPDLLLAKGSMSGPHRRTHPITRWTLAVERITTTLLALLPARTTKD